MRAAGVVAHRDPRRRVGDFRVVYCIVKRSVYVEAVQPRGQAYKRRRLQRLRRIFVTSNVSVTVEPDLRSLRRLLRIDPAG